MSYDGDDPYKIKAFNNNSNNEATEPEEDASYDFGSANNRWNEIYGITYYGDAFNSGSLTSYSANAGGLFGGAWTLGAGATLQATHADIAERYAVDNKVEPGDIVRLGGEAEVTKTTEYGDTEVFGVVSTDPAYMMNSKAGDDQTHPYIALTGRVPCKVINKVKKGDRIVSSAFPGVGIAANIADINPWQVVGRALEDNDDEGFRLIEIVVGKN